jgi:sulfur-oxidizing protein SoxZ
LAAAAGNSNFDDDQIQESKMAEKPRIKLPSEPRKGEIIQIKTLLPHAMENGLRKDQSGTVVPRKIINRFTCEFNGKLVFGCNLETAIAANPYLQFTAKVEESGTFRFAWIDDDGTVTVAEEKIVAS